MTENILTNRVVIGSHPVDLFARLNKFLSNISTNWVEWEPEAILYKLPYVTEEIAIDKVFALQTLANSKNRINLLSLQIRKPFEKIVHAFNNNPCIMEIIQVLEVEEIVYGLNQIYGVLQQVLPKEEHKNLDIYGEIPGYIAACAYHFNWVVLPNVLNKSQELLDHLTGLFEGSTLYKENRDNLEAIKKIASTLDTPDTNILKDITTPFVQKEINRIIGGYLYNPTKNENLKTQ